MFALKMLYLVLLGMWLGSLVALRYILPAAFSKILTDGRVASEAARHALGVGNRLGLACGIGMTGSLFLGTLLSGEICINTGYAAPLIVIFLLLGFTELLYARNRTWMEPDAPAMAKSVLPPGLRLFLFAQIICAIILFGISV